MKKFNFFPERPSVKVCPFTGRRSLAQSVGALDKCARKWLIGYLWWAAEERKWAYDAPGSFSTHWGRTYRDPASRDRAIQQEKKASGQKSRMLQKLAAYAEGLRAEKNCKHLAVGRDWQVYGANLRQDLGTDDTVFYLPRAA